jgi:hypothetical protein
LPPESWEDWAKVLRRLATAILFATPTGSSF